MKALNYIYENLIQLTVEYITQYMVDYFGIDISDSMTTIFVCGTLILFLMITWIFFYGDVLELSNVKWSDSKKDKY
ncbi:hypothetical protein CH367_08930 [Leptospira barantonii]|uniref:Uncharacterized protein n=1 Tax=Leptospira barantonii TaxID=2023184 RepID=A0ABX4NKV7_9LEPT|nr:hypothetical protein CH367_08930 [Leptospira barantonii]